MARFSDVPTLGGSDCRILTLIILRGRASNYSGLHWVGQAPKNRTIVYDSLYDHQGTFYGPGSRASYSLDLLGNLLFLGFSQVMNRTVLQGVGLSGVIFAEVVLTQVLDIP